MLLSLRKTVRGRGWFNAVLEGQQLTKLWMQRRRKRRERWRMKKTFCASMAVDSVVAQNTNMKAFLVYLVHCVRSEDDKWGYASSEKGLLNQT